MLIIVTMKRDRKELLLKLAAPSVGCGDWEQMLPQSIALCHSI
jgi:hypothetical protein